MQRGTIQPRKQAEALCKQEGKMQKVTYYTIPFICHVQNRETHRERKYSRGCLRLREREGAAHRNGISCRDDENVQWFELTKCR